MRKNSLFMIVVVMFFAASLNAATAWVNLDDFNGSSINLSIWEILSEAGGDLPSIESGQVILSGSTASYDEPAESVLGLVSVIPWGVRADSSITSFNGDGWAEISIGIESSNGYEAKIRTFIDNSVTQIETSYEHDHNPIFIDTHQSTSLGAVNNLGMLLSDDEISFYINDEFAASYVLSGEFAVEGIEIEMIGFNSTFQGSIDNVQIVPEPMTITFFSLGMLGLLKRRKA